MLVKQIVVVAVGRVVMRFANVNIALLCLKGQFGKKVLYENSNLPRWENAMTKQDLQKELTNILMRYVGDPYREDTKARITTLLDTYIDGILPEGVVAMREKTPLGFVQTMRMRLKTVKEGDINCAYEDGYTQCLKDITAKRKT